MDAIEPELEVAWQELSFWRDFAIWWNTERSDPSEPRILEVLENAERRYARALSLRQISDYL
jgi:hypothetical protein